MIWTFERKLEIVRVETRVDNARKEYVSESRWSDGRTATERFQDPAGFDVRIRALETELAADNWCQVGSPVITLAGWRGPVTH